MSSSLLCRGTRCEGYGCVALSARPSLKRYNNSLGFFRARKLLALRADCRALPFHFCCHPSCGGKHSETSQANLLHESCQEQWSLPASATSGFNRSTMLSRLLHGTCLASFIIATVPFRKRRWRRIYRWSCAPDRADRPTARSSAAHRLTDFKHRLALLWARYSDNS